MAEVAAIVTLALPIEIPAGAYPVVAGLLRGVVEALPPLPGSPGDRAMARHLLAAAQVLQEYVDASI